MDLRIEKLLLKYPFAQIYMEICHISHYIFYSINFFSCSFWYFFLRYYSHFVFEGISRLSQKEILFLQGWAIWRGVTVRLTPRSLCCFSACTCIFHFQSKEITRVVSHSTCIYIYMYLQKTDRLDTFFCFRELIIVEIGIGYQFYMSVCFPINFLSINWN